jgi:hypothetical protein
VSEGATVGAVVGRDAMRVATGVLVGVLVGGIKVGEGTVVGIEVGVGGIGVDGIKVGKVKGGGVGGKGGVAAEHAAEKRSINASSIENRMFFTERDLIRLTFLFENKKADQDRVCFDRCIMGTNKRA